MSFKSALGAFDLRPPQTQPYLHQFPHDQPDKFTECDRYSPNHRCHHETEKYEALTQTIAALFSYCGRTA